MRLPTRLRRISAVLIATTLSLSVAGTATASWSGTEVTLNPRATQLVIQSHVRYQASAGTIKLTIDNGVANGFNVWLFRNGYWSASVTSNLYWVVSRPGRNTSA
jgi:hypothetical protein